MQHKNWTYHLTSYKERTQWQVYYNVFNACSAKKNTDETLHKYKFKCEMKMNNNLWKMMIKTSNISDNNDEENTWDT